MPFKPGDPKPPNSGRRKKIDGLQIQIKYKPVEWLKPYANNARKNDKAVARMVESIRQYGFTVPILATPDGTIVAGHTRERAARELKMASVPVIVRDNWTEGQVKAFRLLENRSQTWADWDMDALALEFGELKGLDFDLRLTGFDSREIDGLLKFTAQNATEDEVPQVPKDPVTRPGDIWRLGPHRLLCGDSTSAENVARLLDGAQPFLMVTDPPYGVEYDPEWRKRAGINNSPNMGTVLNDDRADWSEAWAISPATVAYVWHGALHASKVAHSLIRTGFEIRSQIIWAKKSLVIGRGHYHWQHEPCWYASKGTAHWKGDRKQSTLWATENMSAANGNVDDGKTIHSTQKPVEVMRRPILNHTSEGESVYDPFLGSGTTLVAAELTERVCFGLEIDPAYCDVIVARWEKLTGRKAERVLAFADGGMVPAGTPYIVGEQSSGGAI